VVAFQRFRAAFDRHGVARYRAVATSAVRTADNRDVLLHRLAHEAGIELDIIDGDEEARLIRKAVDARVRRRARRRAACSTSAAAASRSTSTIRPAPAGARARRRSARCGCSRPWASTGRSPTDGAGMVRRYVATLLQSVMPPIRELGVAAACGGNAEALARMFPGDGEGGAAMPGFDLAALERGLPELLALGVDARMERYGVRRDRAEVLGVAALVLATVGRQLGITRFLAPGVGIREAVLLELAEAIDEAPGAGEREADKAVVTAARAFASRVDHDTSHGEQVRRLARALFTQLRDLHQLPEHLGVVLEVAALLHDVGEVVHTRGHHKHSEYMIRWGRIPGLADPDRELVATLARGHRKSASEAKRVIAESALPKDQRGAARRLLALLRLADGIDSGHRQRFDGVVASRAGNAVVLDLVTAAERGGAIDVEELLRKRDLFEEEFGCTLQVTFGRPVLPDRPELPRGDGGSAARSLGRRLP
jgi:exopolyphosphatase/guanosine-5'-triphosphate,3'-diphosphate pyrophosphatase